MYKIQKNDQQVSLDFGDFSLPFCGKLNSENRWVKLAAIIPWDEFETLYRSNFSDTMGACALPFRVALGALIIKERIGVSDREAVEQIQENPYLQYFLGFLEFKNDPPFDASMFVHFRKRISHDILSQINETLVKASISKQEARKSKNEDGDSTNEPASNRGKLVIDATCTPADIRFPTDISLLNDARIKTEKIIDVLWENRNPNCSLKKKPLTYRNSARKDFLKIIKSQRDRNSMCPKGVKKQLNYLKRNLQTIDKLREFTPLTVLSKFLYRCLLVIHEVYRQQCHMYKTKTHRIADRIVSITQPHVRPIVRGKAGKKVEFGAKISASCCSGYSIVDRISWDAYNEGEDLVKQAESYKERFGHYPLSIHADKIYRNRANREWCKKNNIRLSGPALGRPKKVTEENMVEIQNENKISRQDERDRIDIEGRFGHAKRRYGLGRIMAKLSITSETIISLVFLVMNLEKVLKDLFCTLISWIFDDAVTVEFIIDPNKRNFQGTLVCMRS